MVLQNGAANCCAGCGCGCGCDRGGGRYCHGWCSSPWLNCDCLDDYDCGCRECLQDCGDGNSSWLNCGC